MFSVLYRKLIQIIFNSVVKVKSVLTSCSRLIKQLSVTSTHTLQTVCVCVNPSVEAVMQNSSAHSCSSNIQPKNIRPLGAPLPLLLLLLPLLLLLLLIYRSSNMCESFVRQAVERSLLMRRRWRRIPGLQIKLRDGGNTSAAAAACSHIQNIQQKREEEEKEDREAGASEHTQTCRQRERERERAPQNWRQLPPETPPAASAQDGGVMVEVERRQRDGLRWDRGEFLLLHSGKKKTKRERENPSFLLPPSSDVNLVVLQLHSHPSSSPSSPPPPRLVVVFVLQENPSVRWAHSSSSSSSSFFFSSSLLRTVGECCSPSLFSLMSLSLFSLALSMRIFSQQQQPIRAQGRKLEPAPGSAGSCQSGRAHRVNVNAAERRRAANRQKY